MQESLSLTWRFCCFRTQMYIEADARMDTYTAQDGTNRTQLNLLMRESIPTLFSTADTCFASTESKTLSTRKLIRSYHTGNFEALSRPANRDAAASTTEETQAAAGAA